MDSEAEDESSAAPVPSSDVREVDDFFSESRPTASMYTTGDPYYTQAPSDGSRRIYR